MTPRSALRIAAVLATSLGLAAPTAGCRQDRPAANDMTALVRTAAISPRASHAVRSGRLVVTLPLAPGQAITTTLHMDAEQWTRDAEHVRLESRLRLVAPGEGADDAAAPAAQDQQLTSVINGPRAAWHTTIDNTYMVLDGAAPADGQPAPGPADGLPPQVPVARADVLRSAVRDIVAGYHLNPLADPEGAGPPEVAGRPVYLVVVIPRNARSPRLVANAFRFSRAVVSIDRETYDVLALEGSGTLGVGGASAPLDALGFGAFADALSGVADGPLPMALSITTTEYELDPSFDDERFAFVPPAGATEIDQAALAAPPVEDTAARDAAATAEALASRPAPAPRAVPPSSAEALLAGNALRALAPDAGFDVLTPGYIPPGCAVLDSGRVPEAPTAGTPTRLVWLALTCPSGTLRIEEKAANDTSLAFEEAGARRSTFEVGGDAVTTYALEGGINALVLGQRNGTSVKVSGPEDVAILALIAASMQ